MSKWAASPIAWSRRIRYALDGMVVSYRIHDGDYLLHRLWNDHLNVADLCVVWGDDAGRVDLHAFEFANGEFTCTFQTRSEKDWRAFRLDQISNNHLLTADPALRARIEERRRRRPDPLRGLSRELLERVGLPPRHQHHAKRHRQRGLRDGLRHRIRHCRSGSARLA